MSRSGAPLRSGLPLGALACFGCNGGCKGRLECAQCLEIYRARAAVVAEDCWERAVFCSERCYRASWPQHRARHAETKAGPVRADSRVHTFPAPVGCPALWDGELLKRLCFEDLESGV